MLQRSDEAIRSRWATAFRAALAENQVDRFTYGEVIAALESFAAVLGFDSTSPAHRLRLLVLLLHRTVAKVARPTNPVL
eukprot:909371-Karenia_brevis.AAC.1